MHLLEQPHSHTCNKPIKNNTGYGIIEKWICGKPAVYGTNNGLYFFCRHHSLMQRYVIRKGEIGEIVARFDTEEEIKAAIHFIPRHENAKIIRVNPKRHFLKKIYYETNYSINGLFFNPYPMFLRSIYSPNGGRDVLGQMCDSWSVWRL